MTLIRRKPTEFLFIFDGDCAFCTTAIEILDKTLTRSPHYQPYQFLDLEDFGFSVSDTEEQVWLLIGDRQYGGHRALAKLLQIQPEFGWRFLGFFAVLPGINMLSFALYRLVARYRHLLPGGTPACELANNH